MYIHNTLILMYYIGIKTNRTTIEELSDNDKLEFLKKANRNGYWTLNSWNDEEFAAEYNRITAEHGNFYKVLNEITKAVAEDVDGFVNSYNYDDCDGMTDYFDVNFYYFGCCRNNGENIKVVPKTARIKSAKSELKKANSRTEKPISGTEITDSEAEKAISAPDADQKNGYTYKISRGEDTRDGSPLWIVRIVEKLDREAYIAENKAMKERGAYYSRYLHGFLFRVDPSEILQTA